MEGDAASATEQLVERFGGIRPMAAKLDTPVTTVQGWKKRGIIPQSRHADIMAVAAREGIVLDADILAQTDPGPIGRAEMRPAEAIVVPRAEPAAVIRRSPWAGAALALSLLALIGAAVAGGAAWQLAFKPLEARVAALEARPVPTGNDETLGRRVAALEGEMAASASRPAETPAATPVANAPTGAAPVANADADRLSQIEQQLAQLKSSAAETDQIAKRLADLQIAAGGRELLAQSIRDIQSSTAATQGEVERLGAQLGAAGGRLDRVEAALADRRQQGLKSEAILLGASQLASALGTARPFAKELAALRTLAGSNADMVELLDPLQPLADDGVGTLDDLRNDFGRLAPNIVRSAIVGDGSKWWRQALYHVESVISIRRTGDAVPGNQTDAIVARAEAKLDEDDLKGAVSTLQALSGLPAETAGPWIHDAQQRLAVNAAEAEIMRLSIAQLAGNAPPAAPAPAAAPQGQP